MKRIIAIILTLMTATLMTTPLMTATLAQAEEAHPLSQPGAWSVIVAAGDNTAASGAPTRAFDKARGVVTERLLGAGFEARFVRQFSVVPQDFKADGVRRSTPAVLRRELAHLKNMTGDGCLFYLTSHGDEIGLTFGRDRLTPVAFWEMVDLLCQDQPVIAVLSACYSGIFVEERWRRSNRFILTAARADRTSFGCGEDDVYPFFDRCILENWDAARSWTDLAEKAMACVGQIEAAEGLEPPSEPQLFIGAAIAPLVAGR